MSDQIATYTFLPWLRQGLASEIGETDTLGLPSELVERASVEISLQVKGEDNPVSRNVWLVGPGDVIGISPHAIIRTEPRNWVTDFEPNYLAFIEFYEEDFAWRFTPARAVHIDGVSHQTRLRPWIFLMVLEEGEFEQRAPVSGPLPVIRLTDNTNSADILPPPDQAWAWAHVHVSKDITAENNLTPQQTVDALQRLVRENPDYAVSRLICPRKLKPLTAYHAFLIPTFETGRLAGLGEPTEGIDALEPSWGKEGEEQNEYPVYYRWYFRTGERGNFEYLVNLLEPRQVDERVGIRDMDMQSESYGVQGMIDGVGDVPVMGLEGALKSPQAQPRPSTWPPSDPANYPTFLNELVEVVNLQETLLNLPDSSASYPDPIVSPPLYGRWHALQTQLSVGQAGWVNELNQDPRYRVPAGVGTQVIQKNQETYMQKAWQQLGDVLSANQIIRQVQFSIAASMRLFARHFITLDPDQQIAISQQVHSRILDSSTNEGQLVNTTIFQRVEESRLPGASLQPAFRRVLRPRGPILGKAVPGSGGKPVDILARINRGLITAAPPKGAPEGQLSLNDVTGRLLPSWVPDWLRKALVWKFAPYAFLLLLILILGLLTFVGISVGSAAFSALLVSFLLVAGWIRRRAQASEHLLESNLTTQAVHEIPPHPSFQVTEPGQTLSPGIAQIGESDSLEAANLRLALLDLHARLEFPLPEPVDRPQLNFSATSMVLAEALNPAWAITRRFLSLVAVPEIAPVVAYPVFSDPMYRPLRDLSSELLIPNLNLIPNNSVTLLETNPRFIESYMVGLNHEMARELLWREYPTDQRGSYFRQFWDVGDIVNRDEERDPKEIEEELYDIASLHTWGGSTSLGSHENRILPTGGEDDERKRLVLVIRGDILKRYPTAVIYAQKAKWNDSSDAATPRKVRELDLSDPANNIQEPIFEAEIEPDLRFLGFNLTISAAKGDPTPPEVEGDPGNPGWFFVIQERPGEPRFGLDTLSTADTPPTNWNELAWNHLADFETIRCIDLLHNKPTVDIQQSANVMWGSNAADMAYILYRVPTMVAVHAANMLE